MSFTALSVTLADAVTSALSVIPPVVETMVRSVGSMVASIAWTMSPAAFSAGGSGDRERPASVIPPAVEVAVRAPALIDGRIKLFVEVRETAVNRSAPHSGSPKRRRSDCACVHSEVATGAGPAGEACVDSSTEVVRPLAVTAALVKEDRAGAGYAAARSHCCELRMTSRSVGSGVAEKRDIARADRRPGDELVHVVKDTAPRGLIPPKRRRDYDRLRSP